jgi:biopolymer transport protein TolR
MLQRGTDVQLPQAEQSEPKEEERITLTLTREGRLYLNNQEIPRANLRYRLMALTRNRERVVHFRGDAQVPYGLVIEVMDALKAAGIETVGMITERPSGPVRP